MHVRVLALTGDALNVPVTTSVRGGPPPLWVLRAVRDGMAGSLPGALGNLTIEADKFAKSGMPVEETARRAMGLNPHRVAIAKLLLVDVRRNAPENKPVTETAQSPGDVVNARVQALIAKHPHVDYHEAMGAVLAADPALKTAYART